MAINWKTSFCYVMLNLYQWEFQFIIYFPTAKYVFSHQSEYVKLFLLKKVHQNIPKYFDNF